MPDLIRIADQALGLERFAATVEASDPDDSGGVPYLGLRSFLRPEYRDGQPWIDDLDAASIATVYIANRQLTFAISSVPINLYRRIYQGGREVGREQVFDDHRYLLLRDQPNPYMPAMRFRMALTLQLVRRMRAFIRTNWVDPINYRLESLELMPPDWRVIPPTDGGPPRYVRGSRELGNRDVMYVLGLSEDGWTPQSPAQSAQRSLQIGKALEEYPETYFALGALAGAYVQHPSYPQDKRRLAQLKSAVAAHVQGLRNAHQLAILPDGASIQTNQQDPESAQLVEARAAQRAELAALMGVPPHKVGEMTHATFANIEQQSLDYVTESVMPFAEIVEQTLNLYLLSPFERRYLYWEHDLRRLLRGDSAARAAFYQAMVNIGTMSRDEVRLLENMNPWRNPLGRSTGPLQPLFTQQGSGMGSPMNGDGDAINSEAGMNGESNQRAIPETAGANGRG